MIVQILVSVDIASVGQLQNSKDELSVIAQRAIFSAVHKHYENHPKHSIVIEKVEVVDPIKEAIVDAQQFYNDVIALAGRGIVVVYNDFVAKAVAEKFGVNPEDIVE